MSVVKTETQAEAEEPFVLTSSYHPADRIAFLFIFSLYFSFLCLRGEQLVDDSTEVGQRAGIQLLDVSSIVADDGDVLRLFDDGLCVPLHLELQICSAGAVGHRFEVGVDQANVHGALLVGFLAGHCANDERDLPVLVGTQKLQSTSLELVMVALNRPVLALKDDISLLIRVARRLSVREEVDRDAVFDGVPRGSDLLYTQLFRELAIRLDVDVDGKFSGKGERKRKSQHGGSDKFHREQLSVSTHLMASLKASKLHW
jgi:hypothetical protein